MNVLELSKELSKLPENYEVRISLERSFISEKDEMPFMLNFSGIVLKIVPIHKKQVVLLLRSTT